MRPIPETTGRMAAGKDQRSNIALSFRVKPDFAFLKLRLAFFVDGCFWRGCPKHGMQPKGDATF
jgi:G:T-mismatch repair DNA endonuclease (very short patch repair protein)